MTRMDDFHKRLLFCAAIAFGLAIYVATLAMFPPLGMAILSVAFAVGAIVAYRHREAPITVFLVVMAIAVAHFAYSRWGLA